MGAFMRAHVAAAAEASGFESPEEADDFEDPEGEPDWHSEFELTDMQLETPLGGADQTPEDGSGEDIGSEPSPEGSVTPEARSEPIQPPDEPS